MIERWMLDGANRYLVGSVDYGVDGSAHELGKVSRETRYNLVGNALESCPQGCVERTSIGVTHHYAYDNPQGLLSGRTTEIGFGGEAATGGEQTFSLGYEYDRWGNVSRIYYPDLLGVAGCALTSPTIDLVWDPVALASITDATTQVELFSEPSFDPATGMLVGWKTAAGTADGAGATPRFVNHLITVDGTRARPLRIKAVDPSSPSPALFDTGTYAYDAAGNIRSIGPWTMSTTTSAASPRPGIRATEPGAIPTTTSATSRELGPRTIPVSWATTA